VAGEPHAQHAAQECERQADQTDAVREDQRDLDALRELRDAGDGFGLTRRDRMAMASQAGA